jgi:hypothetical protein
MLPQGALLCSGVSYAAFLVRPELHRDEDEGGLSCGSIPTSASSANWTAVQKRGCKYKIAGSTSKKKFYKNGWGFWTGPNLMCNSTEGVTIYAVVFSLEGTPIPTAWKDLVIAFASVENGEAQAFLPKTPVSLRKYSRSSPAVSANTIFLSEAAHRRRGPNAKARPKGRASFLPKTLGDR